MMGIMINADEGIKQLTNDRSCVPHNVHSFALAIKSRSFTPSRKLRTKAYLYINAITKPMMLYLVGVRYIGTIDLGYRETSTSIELSSI